MPNILTVPKETVVNEWLLPFEGNEEFDVEVVEDDITDTGRWSVHHELTVRIKDKFYKTYYSKGATECQDERPFEYDKEVQFTEVKQVEKVVKVWVEV